MNKTVNNLFPCNLFSYALHNDILILDSFGSVCKSTFSAPVRCSEASASLCCVSIYSESCSRPPEPRSNGYQQGLKGSHFNYLDYFPTSVYTLDPPSSKTRLFSLPSTNSFHQQSPYFWAIYLETSSVALLEELLDQSPVSWQSHM